MSFRNKSIKDYLISGPETSSPDLNRFMGDHVLGIHDLGAFTKGEWEKGISVFKLVLFGMFCLASNGSFLKLINFTMSGGCLLTSPSIFIHFPSARNPPSCSPSDENSRDVSASLDAPSRISLLALEE